MSSSCPQLDELLDLPDRADEVAAHVRDCPRCRRELAAWRAIEHAVRADEAAYTSPEAEPTAARALALVRRARAGAPRPAARWRWPLAVGLPALAAAAALVAVVGLQRTGREHAGAAPLALELLGPPAVDLPRTAVAGTVLASSTRRLVARLGDDRIGVARGSRVAVVRAVAADTRLRLLEGTVAVHAARRARGAALVIEAGDARVRVVGTRFLVALDRAGRVTVEVADGAVEAHAAGAARRVVRAGEHVVLGAGPAAAVATGTATRPLAAAEALELERLLTPEAEPAPPATAAAPAATQPRPAGSAGRAPRGDAPPAARQLDEWRRMVLDGRHAAAEAALARHVQGSPHDSEAWSLLGDCQRKAGQHAAAVATYRRVVRHGDGVLANRARYLAAVTLQDQLGRPGDAAPLLRDYLAQGGGARPLEAAAMVRLARTRSALGDHAAARHLLEDVVRRFPGTPPAREAAAALGRHTP